MIAEMWNDLAAAWSDVVWAGAIQSTIVAAAIMTIVHYGRRWPATLRHALLLVALCKFMIPPVTNIPLGMFSLWPVADDIAPTSLRDEYPPNATNSPRQPKQSLYRPDDLLLGPSAATVSVPESSDATPAQPPESLVGQVANFAINAEIPVTTERGQDANPSAVKSPNASEPDSNDDKNQYFSFYVFGCFVFVFAVVVRALRTYRVVSRLPLVENSLQQWTNELADDVGFRRPVVVRKVSNAGSPFSCGLLTPTVVVSDRELQLPKDQLKAVLLHELVHHRRGDLWVCWWQVVVTSFWWFHPAVWLLNRRISDVREECCDDFLLQRNHVDAEVYCDTLMTVVRGLPGSRRAILRNAISMAGRASVLADRFRRIMDDAQQRQSRLSVGGLVAVIVTAMIALPGLNAVSAPVSPAEKSTPITPAEPKADTTTNRTSQNSSPTDSEDDAETLAKPAAEESNPHVQVKALPPEPAIEQPPFEWPDEVSVVVLHPDETPVPNATVFRRVDQQITEFHADSKGRVTVPLPAHAEKPSYVQIVADVAPYLAIGKTWWFPNRPNIDSEYVFRMKRGRSIGGSIRDEVGRPIANAEIRIQQSPKSSGSPEPQPSSWELSVRSDESGHWLFERLAAEVESVKTQILHDDFISDPDEQWVTHSLLEEYLAKKHTKVLKKGVPIVGRVTDADGTPVEGVELYIGSGYPAPHSDVPVTDRDGRFQFRHCGPGTQPITAWKDGWAPAVQKVTVRNSKVEISYTLTRGRKVSATILDEDGEPIVDALVSMQGWGLDNSLALARHRNFRHYGGGETDQNGDWTWTSAPNERLRLQIRKRGYQSQRDIYIAPNESQKTLTLRKEVVVRGRVTDADTGVLVEEFKLIPKVDSRPHTSRKRNEKEGTFRWTVRERCSSFGIRVEAIGYEPVDVPIDMGLGQVIEANIGLKAVRSKNYVSVFLPDGSPADGASVIIGTRANPGFVYTDLRLRRSADTIYPADEHGRVLLPSLDERFTVAATHKNHFARKTVDWLGGQPRDIELQLQPTTQVSGTLTKNGSPLANEDVDVSFSWELSGQYVSFNYMGSTTNSDGEFDIGAVPSGQVISVHHSVSIPYGQAFRRHPVSSAVLFAQPGANVEVKLGDSGPHALQGRFEWKENPPKSVSWNQLEARLSHAGSLDPGVNSGETWYLPQSRVPLRADGSFEISGLYPGNYRIRFSTRYQSSDVKFDSHVTGSSIFNVFPDNSKPLDLGVIELRP